MALAGFEQAPRFAELIARFLGEDVEFIPPGLFLELDPPDTWFLKRLRAWSTGIVPIAAAPANRGRMQLANPASSNAIVVVKGIGIVTKPTADVVHLTMDAAATGGGISPVNCLDTRQPVDGTGVFGVRPPNQTVGNADAVIGGQSVERFSVAAGVDGYSRLLTEWKRAGLILTPGHNVTIFNNTLNEASLFIAWGTTRPARAEELAA